MFYVEIIGGLGNQMFQYAFYLSLKNYYDNKVIKVYLNRFSETSDNNGYEIENIFGIQTEIETSDLSALIDDSLKLGDRVRRKFIGVRKTYFPESVYKYNPKILTLQNENECYFRGLWQDELYFAGIRDQIVEKFNFKPFTVESKNYKISELIRSSNSVSLHIRRGDYISNEKYNKILGGICSEKYYTLAIEYILKNVKDVNFFVFSDDVDWVRSKYDFLNNHSTVYIDHNNGLDSFMDMQLMSYCKHNIIANSSFSWWGAWLNTNEEKIVLAPKRWFKNNKRLENNHIVPDNWIKIEN